MAKSLKPERKTQNRIVAFFHKKLKYSYLGNLSEESNFNVRLGRLEKVLD